MFSTVIMGFPRPSHYLADLLNTHAAQVRAAAFGFTRTSLIRAAVQTFTADASITMGGPGPITLLRAICEARHRPAIHLWIGSDVSNIANAPAELEYVRMLNVVHWAVSPWLVDELAALGIESRYVPIASAPVPETLAPLPSRFTVLAYLPEPRRDFYGQRVILTAASEMPDTRFVIVGRGGPALNAPPNVEYRGEVRDMDKQIDAASVLVRMSDHDGLSQHVIETLARGRHVIWTREWPGVLRTSSADDALAKLRTLYDAHHAGQLGLNEVGVQDTARHHNPELIARTFADRLREEAHILRPAASNGIAVRNLVVSGSPLFASRVAANCRSYCDDIAVKPLSTRTTSDTVVSLFALAESRAWYTIGEAQRSASLEFTARALRKRRIVHWLGNDVDTLVEHPRALRSYRSSRFIHLAQSEEVARRLEDLGLHATVASLAVLPRVECVASLPKRFTLLLYLPADRPELFGRHQYERLMRALAGEPVEYLVVGGGAITVPAGVAAEQFGWQRDLSAIYARSTALVRFTQTDSFSTMVIEALMHGRHVFWSNRFPYVTQIRDFHDLERAVRSLLATHLRRELRPQSEAACAMRNVYSPESCVRGLAAVCARL